jgi:MFS family permease
MTVVGLIENGNQIAGITISIISTILPWMFIERGNTSDGLMFFLFLLSAGLLCGYLFWGSHKEEGGWHWGYFVLSIVIFLLVAFRARSTYKKNHKYD